MINFNSLHQQGFYTGQLTDIDSNFQIDAEIVTELKSVDPNNYDFYFCVLDVESQPDWPFHLSIIEFSEKLRIVNEKNIVVKQRWREMNAAPKFNELRGYFRKFIVGFIRDAYPEIREDFSNLIFIDKFSYFEKDDFIFPHNDGNNQGRLCVVLLHLNTISESADNGGQLIVYAEDDKTIIDPVIGTFTVLDFNNHNLIHEVTKVLNDFKRYTYICFLYNTDRVGNNWIEHESQKYKS